MSEFAASGSTPQYLSVDGVRLEAYRVGPEIDDAPTPVFLHQGLGSARLWLDFAARVCTALGLGGLVYSRRGYGGSDPLRGPLTPSFMHDEALEVLPAVLEAASISDPILIGHSDGASIALIYAGSGAPVRALSLEAPHVFVEEVTRAGIVAGRERFQTGDLRERLVRHHGANTDRTFDAWSDVWLSSSFRDWDIAESVRRVRCPTLVVQGTADPYGTLAQVESIVRSVAGPVDTVLLPGCGHSPHRECPTDVVESIYRFSAQNRLI
jgi:pimeloyl-ACP methyl ester carboxylesterase